MYRPISLLPWRLIDYKVYYGNESSKSYRLFYIPHLSRIRILRFGKQGKNFAKASPILLLDKLSFTRLG